MQDKLGALETANRDLKDDLVRKTRQSADLSLSLKKSLVLIQQQNRALTDQLQDLSSEKDAQIDALAKQLNQKDAVAREQAAGAVPQEAQAALLQLVGDLKQQLGQTQREKEELAAQSKRQEQQVGDSSVESAAYKEKLGALEAELERSKKSAWDRYLTITQQGEAVSALEQRVYELAEKDRLQNQLEQEQPPTLASAQDKQEDQQQMQMRALRTQNASLEQEQAHLREALKAAEENVFEQQALLGNQKAALAEKLGGLQEQVRSLQGQQSGHGGELQQLKDHTLGLQEMLVREQGRLSAEGGKAADLQASLDMHIALVSSLRLKLAALQDHGVEEIKVHRLKEVRVADVEAELVRNTQTMREAQRVGEVQAAELQRLLDAGEANAREAARLMAGKELELKEAERKLGASRDAASAEQQALQEQLLRAAAELREEQDVRDHHQTQAMANKRQASDADVKLRDLREKLDAQAAEAVALAVRLAASVQLAQDGQAAAEVQRRGTDLAAVRAAKATSDAELREQRKKLVAATEALAANERELKQLGVRLADSERSDKEKAEGLRGKAAASELQLQEYREALAAQGRHLDELERQKRALDDALGAKTDEVGMLQRQAAGLQTQLQVEMQARKIEAEASHSMRLAAVDSSQGEFLQFRELSDRKMQGIVQQMERQQQQSSQVQDELHEKIQQGHAKAEALSFEVGEKHAASETLAQHLHAQKELAAAELKAVQDKAAAAAKTVQLLQGDVADRDERLGRLEGEQRVLSTQLRSKEDQLGELGGQATAGQLELMALLDEQTALVCSLKIKLAAVQAQLGEEQAARKAKGHQLEEEQMESAQLRKGLADAEERQQSNEADQQKSAADSAEIHTQLHEQALAGEFEATQMAAKLADTEAQLAQALAELRDSESGLGEVKADREKHASAAEVYGAKAESSAAYCVQLQVELQEQARAVETLHRRLAEQESNALAEQSASASEREAQEGAVAGLKAGQGWLEDALGKTRRMHDLAVAQMHDEIAQWSAQVEELRAALAVKEAGLQSLQGRLDQLDGSHKSLSQSAQDWQREVLAAAEKLAAAEARVLHMVQAHDQQKDELQKQAASRQQLNERLGDLQCELDEQTLASAALTAELADVTRAAAVKDEAWVAEAAQLAQQIAELQKEAAHLQGDLDRTRKMHDAACSEMNGEIAQDNKQMEELDRKLLLGETERAALEEQLAVQLAENNSVVQQSHGEALVHVTEIERLHSAVEKHLLEAQAQALLVAQAGASNNDLVEQLDAQVALATALQVKMDAVEAQHKATQRAHAAKLVLRAQDCVEMENVHADLEEALLLLQKQKLENAYAAEQKEADLLAELRLQAAKVVELVTQAEKMAARASEQEAEMERLAVHPRWLEQSHKAALARLLDNATAVECATKTKFAAAQVAHDALVQGHARLEEARAQTQIERGALLAQIAVQGEQLLLLRAEHEVARAEQERQLTDAAHRVDDLGRALKAKSSEAKQLQGRLEQGSTALAKGAADSQQRQGEAKAEARAQQEALARLTNEALAQGLRADTAEARVVKLQRDCAQLEAQQEALRSSANELERGAAEAKQAHAKEGVAKAKVELLLGQAKAEAAAACDRLQKKLADLSGDLGKARAEKDALAAEFTAAIASGAGDRERLAVQLRTAEADLHRLLLQVHELMANEVRLNEQLEHAGFTEERLQIAKDELSATNEIAHDVGRISVEREREVHRLRDLLAVKEAAMREMEPRLAELTVQSDALLQKIAQLRTELQGAHALAEGQTLAAEKQAVLVQILRVEHASDQKKLTARVEAVQGEHDAKHSENLQLKAATAVMETVVMQKHQEVASQAAELHTQRQHFDRTFTQMQFEVEQKDRRLETMSSSVNEHQEQVRGLQTVVAAVHVEKTDIALEHAQVASDHADTLERLAEAEGHLKAMRPRLTAVMGDLARLQEQKAISDAELADTAAQLMVLQSESELLQGKHGALSEEAELHAAAMVQHHETQRSLATQASLLGALQKRAAALEEQMRVDSEAAAQDSTEKQQALKTLSAKTEQLADALGAADAKEARAKAELETRREEDRAKAEQLRALTTALDGKEAELRELQRAVHQLGDDRQTMQLEGEQLGGDLTEARGRLLEAEALLKCTQEELRFATDATQQGLADLERRQNDARDERDAVLQQLVVLQAQLAVEQEGGEELLAEKEALRQQLGQSKLAATAATDKAQREYDELQRQMDEQIALNDAAKAKLISVTKKAGEDLDAASARLAAKQGEAAELAAAKADLEDALRRAQAKTASLERDLGKTQETLDRTAADAQADAARRQTSRADLAAATEKQDAELVQLQKRCRALEDDRSGLEHNLNKQRKEAEAAREEQQELVTELHAAETARGTELEALLVAHAKALLEAQEQERQHSKESLAKKERQHLGKAEAALGALTAKDAELLALQKTLGDQGGHMAGLQADRDGQTVQLSSLEKEQEVLQLALADSGGEVLTLRAALAEAQEASKAQALADVAPLQEAVSSLNLDLDLHIALVATLRMKVQALQEQIREAAHSQIRDQATVAAREAELALLQAEQEQRQSAYVASLATVNEDLRRERESNAVLQQEMDTFRTDVSSTQVSLGSRMDELQRTQAEVALLEERLRALDEEKKRALAAGQEQLRAAQQDLRDRRRDLGDSEGAVGALHREKHEAQEALAAQTAALLRLRKEAEASREEHQEQAALIAQLRAAQAGLKAQAEEEAHRRVRQEATAEEQVSGLEVAQSASDRFIERLESTVADLSRQLLEQGKEKEGERKEDTKLQTTTGAVST